MCYTCQESYVLDIANCNINISQLRLTEEIIIEEDDLFGEDDSIDGQAVEQYQCGICSKIFSSKKNFIQLHINIYAKKLTCCKCIQVFETSDDLYEHHETHKEEENYGVIYQEASQEGEELIFMDDGEELLEIQQAGGEDLLYILDDTDQNCVNEVIVQEDQIVQIPGRKHNRKSSEAAQLVSLEHGYMLPDSFEDSTSSDGNVVFAKRLSLPATSTSTKRSISPPKPRAPQLRRRHEVPDFSATNYVIVEPNEELDTTHFKCQRCEQLFINKFGFFRHIEKGKCYVNNCDVCKSTFTSNSDFYAHYTAEHTDRAICNFCFRTFMYEKNVKEHMLRHLDQFRHRCEECNKGFYTVREYRNHYKNRHMGIRHKCDVCGRSFADEYYFRKHMATHAKAAGVTVLKIQKE